MPLTQGEIIGYKNQSMSYQFTMISQSQSIIHCEISSAALSDIAGPRTSTHSKDRQFAEHRVRIELVASDVFDAIHATNIRLYAKHLK